MTSLTIYMYVCINCIGLSCQLMLDSWPVLVWGNSWESFWARKCFMAQENQSPLFTRSFLSVLEKVYEGAERMAVQMWAQKLVKPVDKHIDHAIS